MIDLLYKMSESVELLPVIFEKRDRKFQPCFHVQVMCGL